MKIQKMMFFQAFRSKKSLILQHSSSPSAMNFSVSLSFFFIYVREKIVDCHPVLWIALLCIRLVTKSGTSSSHSATLLKYWACPASAGVHYFPAYGWKSTTSSTLPPFALSITYPILDKHLPSSFNAANIVI